MVETVWLVRHGMRLNFENPEWELTAPRPHDSPISATGLQQADHTAAFLSGKGIKHLFASPFYRTLQTADRIAETLSLPIRVEYGFYEWLNPAWISAYPEIIPLSEALAEFPRIDPAYRSYSTASFPEVDENEHVYARVKPALEGILRDFEGSIAIVGHGASVYQAARALVNPPTGFLKDMCAVNRLELQCNEWRLTFSSTAHLSSPGQQATRLN